MSETVGLSRPFRCRGLRRLFRCQGREERCYGICVCCSLAQLEKHSPETYLRLILTEGRVRCLDIRALLYIWMMKTQWFECL